MFNMYFFFALIVLLCLKHYKSVLDKKMLNIHGPQRLIAHHHE